MRWGMEGENGESQTYQYLPTSLQERRRKIKEKKCERRGEEGTNPLGE
jgi:hypothetical protein